LKEKGGPSSGAELRSVPANREEKRNEKEISLKWKKGRERQRKMKSYGGREVRSTAGAVRECEIQSNV